MMLDHFVQLMLCYSRLSSIRGLGFGLPAAHMHIVRFNVKWGYMWTREPSSGGGCQTRSIQSLKQFMLCVGLLSSYCCA